jgi:hypothetical protein
MPRPLTRTYPKVVIARLIATLRDNRQEKRPLLADKDAAFARSWLERILVDSPSLIVHLEELKQASGHDFPLPKWRRDLAGDETSPEHPPDQGGRKGNLLSETQAQAIVDQGTAAFDIPGAIDVGALLLDPFALCELADLIDWQFPEAWMDAMARLGKEARAEDNPRPEFDPDYLDKLIATGCTLGAPSDCLSLPFAGEQEQALARRIAERLYGNTDVPVRLRLYWTPAVERTDHVQVTMEVSPRPVRGPLDVRVVFPTGLPATFGLPVSSVSAGAAEEWASSPPVIVPLAAVRFQQAGEWSATVWPPEVRFLG